MINGSAHRRRNQKPDTKTQNKRLGGYAVEIDPTLSSWERSMQTWQMHLELSSIHLKTTSDLVPVAWAAGQIYRIEWIHFTNIPALAFYIGNSNIADVQENSLHHSWASVNVHVVPCLVRAVRGDSHTDGAPNRRHKRCRERARVSPVCYLQQIVFHLWDNLLSFCLFNACKVRRMCKYICVVNLASKAGRRFCSLWKWIGYFSRMHHFREQLCRTATIFADAQGKCEWQQFIFAPNETCIINIMKRFNFTSTLLGAENFAYAYFKYGTTYNEQATIIISVTRKRWRLHEMQTVFV